MRKIAAAVLTAGLLAVSWAPASAGPLRLVGHQGRWLVDSSGRVLIVHGLNVIDKRPPYEPAALGFGAADANFLRAHGFNAVRLGVIPEAVEPSPGNFDDRYLTNIAATVDLLGRYGIRSLLDFHQDLYNERFQGEGLPSWMVLDDGLPSFPSAGFPGNYFSNLALNHTFDNFWHNAAGPGGIGVQDRFAALVAHVAARFRGDPAVLGYDIFNEPWPGSVWPACFTPPLGCATVDASLLAPFNARVSKVVHAADPTHIGFYEPWQTFSYSNPTYLTGPATGFSFHVYCLAAVGAPETPPTRDECNSIEQTDVTHAVAYGVRYDAALLLTEFGATTDASELHEVIGLTDHAALPWLEWAYCLCNDPTGNASEGLVSGGHVDAAKLAILDEPYPQAVAGVPVGYHFDAATGVFTFRYTTGRAGGGRFAPGTLTQIWIGTLHYPTGYRVRLSGARTVSAGRVLSLATSPGASVVTVTVSPAVPSHIFVGAGGVGAPATPILPATGGPRWPACAALALLLAGLSFQRGRARRRCSPGPRSGSGSARPARSR